LLPKNNQIFRDEKGIGDGQKKEIVVQEIRLLIKIGTLPDNSFHFTGIFLRLAFSA
jgi:hypothetical protein